MFIPHAEKRKSYTNILSYARHSIVIQQISKQREKHILCLHPADVQAAWMTRCHNHPFGKYMFEGLLKKQHPAQELLLRKATHIQKDFRYNFHTF